MKRFFTFAFLLFLGIVSASFAQTDFKGMTNRGTEFWFSFPVNWAQFDDNSLKVYVSCDTAVACTLEIPGLGVKFIKMTKANDVIDFTINEPLPYEKDDTPGSAQPEVVLSGLCIHVTSPVPISVQAVSLFKGNTESFLVLPVSSLGKEYIVGSYAEGTGNNPLRYLPSQTVIVAAYDNTAVNFRLGGSTNTETVGGMKIGQSKTVILRKGDVFAFANKKINGVYGDLSGSKITATKPVAVISGNQCAYVDVGTQSCSYLAEMELPTMAWGREFHVTNIKDRQKYSFLKIFAKNPGTQLYRDGSSLPFATIQTSGGVAGSGYFEGRVLDDASAPHPVTIRADGPISIMQYNPGQADDNVPSAPFQMVLTPVEQYQREIIFSTPGIKGGEGFKDNYVNLVFEGNSDGSMPADLEFGTVAGGKIQWKSLQLVFGYDYTPFTTFSGDTKKFFQKTITLPGDGVYAFRALKPLAVYQYGYDGQDSYGNPACVWVKDMTKKDTSKPKVTAELCCGEVCAGTVEDMPRTETAAEERSNMAVATLLSGSSNYIFEAKEFIPGDDKMTTWKLLIEDRLKPAVAHIYFADRAGNDTTLTFRYTPPQVEFSTTTLNFGTVSTNTAKTLSLTITNRSASEPYIIMDFKTGIKIGDNFSFATPPTFPDTLLPMASRTFDITFNAPFEGNFRDSVLFNINGCTPVGAELMANVGESNIQVTDVPFGIVPVNTTVTKPMTVTNSGNIDLVITEASTPQLSVFTLSGNGWAISDNTPLILGPGQTQNMDVTFNTASEGNFVDTVFFKTNATRTKNYSVLTAGAIKTSVNSSEELNYFTISPNPATGFATITLPLFKSEGVVLKIYDALGAEVADLSNDLFKTEVKFDTKALPNGAYFLRFSDGETTFSKSFVIQN